MQKNTAPHILPTASNLLGFAFIALTSIKGFGVPHSLLVDKLIVLLIFILAASCSFSFASIRNEPKPISHTFERNADYLFIAALLLIVLFAGLLAFDLFFVMGTAL